MIKDQNRNKDRFKNWQFCGFCKLSFREHRGIKLTQHCLCFTNTWINLLVLPSLINTIPTCMNVAVCYSVLPLTCSIHCLGFLGRHNISTFLVLVFIPAWSHAAENRSSTCWGPCWEDVNSTKSSEKITVDLAACNSDTFDESTVTVYPIHIGHAEEWLQHTPLLESNTHCERLWFNSADTDTNFWEGIRWLDGR